MMKAVNKYTKKTLNKYRNPKVAGGKISYLTLIKSKKGKTTWMRGWSKKSNAKQDAKNLRKKGYLVRIKKLR
jgi:hypothetical protein